MFTAMNKIKLYFYAFIFVFALCSCKSSDNSKKTKTTDSSSSSSSSEESITSTSSSDTSTTTTTTTTTEDSYTEESYDERIIKSFGVNFCDGLYKINKDCTSGWTRTTSECNAYSFSRKTDDFYKKVSDYISQGYTRIFCYSKDSGSGYAVSLIKYDVNGAHQKIVIKN